MIELESGALGYIRLKNEGIFITFAVLVYFTAI